MWSFPQVKEEKTRVLDNSVRVCVNHHRVANALKEVADYVQREHITVDQVVKLVNSMPKEMKETWRKIGAALN